MGIGIHIISGHKSFPHFLWDCLLYTSGYTAEAGYCLSASATREDTHLIAVALGCGTSQVRNAEVSKLLDYGFANVKTCVIAEKGQVMEEIRVEKMCIRDRQRMDLSGGRSLY